MYQLRAHLIAMSFNVSLQLPDGTCPVVAFPGGASTAVRDLMLAVFGTIGPAPDGFEDTFTLAGEGCELLTAESHTFDSAGINNEATVIVTRRRECNVGVLTPSITQ